MHQNVGFKMNSRDDAYPYVNLTAFGIAPGSIPLGTVVSFIAFTGSGEPVRVVGRAQGNKTSGAKQAYMNGYWPDKKLGIPKHPSNTADNLAEELKVRVDVSSIRCDAEEDVLVFKRKTAVKLPELPRRAVSAATERDHVKCVHEYYKGMCPRCAKVRIVDESGRRIGGHIDHWTDNHNRNSVFDTWLICEACNAGFNNAVRSRSQHLFDTYKERMMIVREVSA